jgi:hypothetical protein
MSNSPSSWKRLARSECDPCRSELKNFWIKGAVWDHSGGTLKIDSPVPASATRVQSQGSGPRGPANAARNAGSSGLALPRSFCNCFQTESGNWIAAQPGHFPSPDARRINKDQENAVPFLRFETQEPVQVGLGQNPLREAVADRRQPQHPTGAGGLREQNFAAAALFECEPEHEILRKTFPAALYRLMERFGRDAVEFDRIGIERDLPPADEENAAFPRK